MTEIIRAALKCFSEKGVVGTTMAEIRRISGASHGSIYHHFKSKEQLAAAVYLEGIAAYQAGMLQALEGQDGAREGLFALVCFHLSWVERNPDWSRYLFQMRHAAFMKESETDLDARNKAWFKQLSAWFLGQIEAGNIRRLPPELYIALIFGPCQEMTRLWLAGQVSSDMGTLVEEIAEAVWKALRAT